MYKLIAGALLFTASAAFGVGIKKLFRERLKTFEEFRAFTDYAEREIKCMKTPVNELAATFAKGSKGVCRASLEKYSDGLKFGYKSAEEVLEKTRSVYLSKGDNLLIASFLYGLGRNDFDAEIANIERYKSVFEEKKRVYELELKKNGDMYYKLFVLLGITVMLVVV